LWDGWDRAYVDLRLIQILKGEYVAYFVAVGSMSLLASSPTTYLGSWRSASAFSSFAGRILRGRKYMSIDVPAIRDSLTRT
jgi:hypothetical protein